MGKNKRIITLLSKEEVEGYAATYEGPCLALMPVPKKHRTVVIKANMRFDALRKGKYYTLAFADKLDSRCSKYLLDNNVWDTEFSEELFEISGRDLFAWIAVEDGSHYFLGVANFSMRSEIWDVVEEGRQVIVEKMTSV